MFRPVIEKMVHSHMQLYDRLNWTRVDTKALCDGVAVQENNYVFSSSTADRADSVGE